MAPNLSKYLSKNNVCIFGGLVATLWIVTTRNYRKKTRIVMNGNNPKGEEVQYVITEKYAEKVKAHVNRKFFQQLLPIIKVVIPGWNSTEAGYAIFVALCLIAKTYCDLLLIQNITSIESSLILRDKQHFTKRVLTFLATLPLISLVGGLLKYTVGELKIRLRKNLSLHLYNDYLEKLAVYRVVNLDNRISNADQVLTADIGTFCDCLADLYCNVSKPLLDIGVFSYKVSNNLGLLTPGIIFGYLLVSGVLLTRLRRPIGQLTIMEQKLEGEFRHVNSRLIMHAEEIAFYQGNMREKLTLITSFNNLIKHLRKFLRFRVIVGVIDNIVTKYLTLSIGWFTYSIPFFMGSFGLNSMAIGERSKVYYSNGMMVLKLAQSAGRLVLAGGDLNRLAGLTVRMTELQHVLKDIADGTYQKTIVQRGTGELNPNGGKLTFLNNIIKFEKVPIVTPKGDVLVKEITIDIRSGMNVLVCGPNGSGKSSIFRILGELWPLFGGKLTKPPSGKLFYIPQKPYMALGTLRDQVTYPHSGAHAKRRGFTDEQLEQYLKLVQLEYVLEREGGFDALDDWSDILSGGEKQRIAMARLFYHSPQFAILDECTSAVAVDVEDRMYAYCRQVGITLLTVSHRKSLWKHHEYVLYLDGRGNYNFSPIEEDMEQFGS